MHPSPFFPVLTTRALRRAVVALALAALGGLPARAEKADRFKPLNVESELPGKLDLLNQFVVFNGNVVVTKGTMVIRANRIEVRETPEGYHNAVALGSPGRPATFRQKRDGVDEFIDGAAEKLEFDGKSDVVRFINNADVRRMRGAEVADEVIGNLVTYDSTTEVFNVSGGQKPTPSNPGSRSRVTLVPKEGTAAAAEARAAADAALAASAPTPAPLKQSSTLGNGR